MEKEKVEPVEKIEPKTEEVKAVENKSDQKVEKQKAEQKTEQDKVEEKREKTEAAGKKPANAEKDEKATKAAAKASAAKPAVTNGAPGKDSTSPEKKTKVCGNVLLCLHPPLTCFCSC